MFSVALGSSDQGAIKLFNYATEWKPDFKGFSGGNSEDFVKLLLHVTSNVWSFGLRELSTAA